MSFCVGATGAGVPTPSSAKRANESTSPGTPAMINTPPRTRVSSTPKNARRSSHCVIHHGTRAASINGAMTKNRAEPKTAVAFDIACSQRSDKNSLANHFLLRALNVQLVVPAVNRANVRDQHELGVTAMAYVMVDVESDGPIPGDYSMICFGAVIVKEGLEHVFYGRLKPISEKWIPEALAVSGFTREDTLGFDDPKNVIESFGRWIQENAKVARCS